VRFEVRAARSLLRLGRRIFVRSASLHVALLVAAAAITRFGDASIAAHQITFQLWVLLAFVLDAFAIAGQVIIARELGAGVRDAAFAGARCVVRLAVTVAVAMAVVVGALYDVLPRAFSGDPTVIARAQLVWPIFVVLLPLSGAVYALDGILLGAGDARYLMWAMVAAAAGGVALSCAAVAFRTGIVGVWAGLAAMTVVRLATLTLRFRRRRWAAIGVDGVFA
jgi:Na+-driven multidrug efflux pump